MQKDRILWPGAPVRKEGLMDDLTQSLIVNALIVPIAFGVVMYAVTTIGIKRAKIRSTGRLHIGRAIGAVVKETEK